MCGSAANRPLVDTCASAWAAELGRRKRSRTQRQAVGDPAD
jgi:hypothetical protein